MKKEKKEKKEKLSKEEKKLQNGSFKERFSIKFRKRILASRFRTLILVVILVAIFIVLNVWANSKDLAQIDVTESKLYSLTEASKDQLKDLNNLICNYYSKNLGIDIDFLQIRNSNNGNIKDDTINSFIQNKYNTKITEDNIEDFINKIYQEQDLELIFYVKIKV